MAQFTFGQLAPAERMQYDRPSGQSAFLQGMQEAQAVGDLWRKNQLEQAQLKRMETGRGMALGALANPNDPNAKLQFAQGIAEQGDLKGAQQMIWPSDSGIGQAARDQKTALDAIKGVEESVEAYVTLSSGIDAVPAKNAAIATESDEGQRILARVMQTVNAYMKLMSGAAVTTGEAQRLLSALGVPQLADALIGMESGPGLEAVLLKQMQTAQNAKTTFNPARVRNEMANIANNLRNRMNMKVSMLQPINPNAYAMALQSINKIGSADIQLVDDSAAQDVVSKIQVDPSQYSANLGKIGSINKLEEMLGIARSLELANLVARNEGIKAAVVANDTLPYQKMLAQFTSNLGINANAESIRQASQEVRDKVAMAQAALKRGGPNAAAEAQQHLAGTGFSIKDVAVPALTAEQIKRTKSESQYRKPEAKKKGKPPIKKGEKGVTGNF